VDGLDVESVTLAAAALDFYWNHIGVPVQVREMVISLPLVVGGIWVRTDDGVLYFAKFSHSTVEELRTLLKKAQQNE